MNAGRTAPSATKPPSSSRENTRLWKLPAYGKPLESASSHRPWKTPPIHRPRFPQLPQPLLLEEKKPELDDESGSPSSTPLSYRPVRKPGSRHCRFCDLCTPRLISPHINDGS